MSDPPSPVPISDARLRRYAWMALVIAIALAVWGIVSRVTARAALGRGGAGGAATAGGGGETRGGRGGGGVGRAAPGAAF
jgi:hypothetical protein